VYATMCSVKFISSFCGLKKFLEPLTVRMDNSNFGKKFQKILLVKLLSDIVYVHPRGIKIYGRHLSD
jgi:hypothetical protein